MCRCNNNPLTSSSEKRMRELSDLSLDSSSSRLKYQLIFIICSSEAVSSSFAPKRELIKGKGRGEWVRGEGGE